MFNGTSLILNSDVDQDHINVWLTFKIPNLSMHHLIDHTNQDIRRR